MPRISHGRRGRYSRSAAVITGIAAGLITCGVIGSLLSPASSPEVHPAAPSLLKLTATEQPPAPAATADAPAPSKEAGESIAASAVTEALAPFEIEASSPETDSIADAPLVDEGAARSPAVEDADATAEHHPDDPRPGSADASADDQPRPTFDGRPIRPVKKVRMLVTAYSPDARSCGEHADGITASGYSVYTNGMKLVAADKSLPFGTVLTIPGYDNGYPVPVLDRGGAIKGRRLDVLFPTHEEALEWGKRWVEVTIWEYADEPEEEGPALAADQ